MENAGEGPAVAPERCDADARRKSLAG